MDVLKAYSPRVLGANGATAPVLPLTNSVKLLKGVRRPLHPSAVPASTAKKQAYMGAIRSQQPVVCRVSQIVDQESGSEAAETPKQLVIEPLPTHATSSSVDDAIAARKQQRQREQVTYQFAAVAASVGVTSLAIVATYLRFHWHMEDDGMFPWGEMFGTLSLVAGGVFGMEMWARFAHKVLWHDYQPGWALHKSHHEPRTGPFEANDLYAIANGVPAMALCAYGFLTPGMVGSLCFGAGLGITLFGIMYMFVHDGLVHRRFPVGPIANMPYMKQLAVAHQLHHAGKYGGAPWGMFLAPQELEAFPGAKEDMERMVAELDWSRR
mmetsp:Transcript_15104/g.32729  ORF Transcript_15104/g.32729 Transcript_15104/m.32729 type:complete len:324 (-) Transcript_15104:1299-2270(-)